MATSEELREALVDLAESRARERQQREMSEALLAGLHAIVLARDPDEIFRGLLDILREPLDFEAAFVLRANRDGALTATASSDPSFDHTVWEPRAMFERIFAGQPVAAYDTGLVDEWCSQPDPVKQRARSALHFSIRGSEPRALFVCTHPDRAHFSRQHVALARRFSVLATQALQTVELNSRLADLQARLDAGAKLAAANEELARSQSQLRQVIDLVPHMIYATDRHGRFIMANKSTAEACGTTADDMVGKSQPALLGVSPDEYASFLAEDREVIDSGRSRVFPDEDYTYPDGHTGILQTTKTPFTAAGVPAVLGISIDITKRKEAEQERAVLEQQLRQSQRMESVGRLAGGVAHDFNNLLTVILSSCVFIAKDLREGDPLLDDVREIEGAGKRAVSLTRQLLAFSRKQVLQTEVLDLNRILTELDKMLRRLIGEDIDLVTEIASGLGKVMADPGQMEQIVMNLAVNARDAMPRGGKLIVETMNVVLDEEYARTHADVTPGPHVMLAVSDTGHGMDAETAAQVFDPFFTTKEKGKGTGLGLSMVYGIVKQHGGNIWVYSEPGKGTTFKIYLPGATATEEEVKRARAPVGDRGGNETVLVAEDEAPVLRLTVRVLEARGYRVLQARDGLEGRTVANENDGPIHLLLTDVVMPKSSGTELAEKLQAQRPELKVIYMSGYTDNAIMHHGLIDQGSHFLQKPFDAESLSRKVREVLDEPAGDKELRP